MLDHLARSWPLSAMAQKETAPEGAMPRLLEVLQESFPSQEYIRQCLGSLVTEYIVEPMSSLRTYLCSSTSGQIIWPADAAVFDGVNYASLLSWLQAHVVDEAFLKANVVQVVSGNRNLANIDHYRYTARLQAGRTAWASRDANGDTETWHVVFLKFGAESGLSTLHYTWAFVPALHALMLAFPDKTFISLDDDCSFLTLFDMSDLRTLAKRGYDALKPGLYGAPNFMPGIYTCSDESTDVNAGFTIHPRADGFPSHTAWLAYTAKHGLKEPVHHDATAWTQLIQCHKQFFTEQAPEIDVLTQLSDESDVNTSWRNWEEAAKASLLEGTPFYGRFAQFIGLCCSVVTSGGGDQQEFSSGACNILSVSKTRKFSPGEPTPAEVCTIHWTMGWMHI